MSVVLLIVVLGLVVMGILGLLLGNTNERILGVSAVFLGVLCIIPSAGTALPIVSGWVSVLDSLGQPRS